MPFACTHSWRAGARGARPLTGYAVSGALPRRPATDSVVGPYCAPLQQVNSRRPSSRLSSGSALAGRRLRQLLGGAAAGVAAGVLTTTTRGQGFSGCTTTPVVDKPETHRKRSYEHLQLKNGLSVLLASDPDCDKAAAALCVGVGRLHEPKHIPGLAHFCEHMLFLGTEAFPDEAEYKRFVKRHGGKCNAATGDSSTCYAFDVAREFLAGALDRFSQFFLTPLFTPSATEREINAVDSEHSMRIQDDGRRSYATLLMDANPRHPLHWGSGNAQSLRDTPRAEGLDPHGEVVKFYRENYSSEDMTLAVLGRQSPAELREMVESRFGDVRATGKRALRGNDLGGPEPPLMPQDFRGMVLRVPSKDIRRIAFSWQLPEWQVPMWQSKPTAYASHLLGHEGEGSLLSALKSKGWATALGAGVDEFGSFSQFEVSVALTEEGLDSVVEVGSLVFRYLRLVLSTPLQPWVLREAQQLREIRYRFADDVQPYSLVNRLAKNLQHYPPEQVLAAPVKLPSPDTSKAAGILACLTVEGVRVELVAKRFAEQCTSSDPWYGGKYLRKPVEDSWYAAWHEAAGDTMKLEGGAEADAAIAAAAQDGMRLPQPNAFIPQDLSLRPLTGSSPPRAPTAFTVPAKAGIARGFHRQDDRFLQPKACIAIRFHSPAASKDAASYLRCQVWCDIVMEELNEYVYAAEEAGLAYELTAVPGGLELYVAGFNDKLPLLLRTVAKKMRSASSVAPGAFAVVYDRYKRGLKNRAEKQRPVDFAQRKARELLHSLSFPVEDQLAALMEMKVSDLDGTNSLLLEECHAEALLAGNLAEEEAADTVALVGEELGVPTEPAAMPWRAEATLPPGYTVWRLDGTNAEEPNNCVRLVLQLPLGLETSVHTALLVRVLSPRFFEELRTKQQLGYIVQLSWTEHEGFISVICTVQTEYPPDYVRDRIDAFWEAHLSWLDEGLDAEDFARQRAGLASNYAEAPKNLREEFGQYWSEITRQRYQFGRREQKRLAVEATELEAFRAFVRDRVRAAPRLYLQVQNISGKEGKSPPAGTASQPRTPDRVWEGAGVAREFRDAAEWASSSSRESESARL